MTSISRPDQTPSRRLMTRAVALLTATVIAVGAAAPGVVAAPTITAPTMASPQQSVDWMSSDTASYLGSIGMDVMVPSWIPSPFTGVPPDVYAGDGSYSLYWMAPGSPPTFLHITGVVGGGFPDGSKADLNVPLSINESVQGWPAIRDIGIPAGSSTPIYDQVWWIVDGVRYSIESNNIGTDSLTLANSMLFLDVPVYEEPAAPPPVVEEPAWEDPTSAPVWEAPAVAEPTGEEPTSAPVDTAPTTDSSSTSTDTATESVGGSTGQTSSGESTGTTAQTSTGESTETSSGPWSPSRLDGNVPSDGTAGPRPPVIGSDGTGGSFDTSLPRLVDVRP